MKKNSLANTNKHLRDPKKRAEMIVRFAYGAGKHEGLKITLRETRKAYQAIFIEENVRGIDNTLVKILK